MAERLFGLSDVGGTQQRVEVWNGDMELVGAINGVVDPSDYFRSVESIAGNMRRIAEGNGELVAVSVAVASELDSEKRLVLGGALRTWDGKCIGGDVGEAAGVPRERAGTLNDMEAVAESQLAVNAARGILETGYVTTLSSGWGGKPYSPDNGGMIGYEFVTDLSTATIALIERNAEAGFDLDVIRWMGGVATGQPVLMHRAEGKVREAVGPQVPGWEAVTLGGKAGLHGAFIDARRLSLAA